MGVAGLTAFVERATRHVDLIAEGRRLAALRKAGGGAASSNEIVVDGNGLFRRLYSPHIDWVRGGQFERLAAEVRTFVERFTRAGWALTVVFDGQIEATKRKVWVSRRTVEARRAEQIMDYLAAQEMLPPESQQMPPKKLWFLPVSTTRAIPNAFRDAGCEVHFSLGEADREIAHRAIEKGAYAVLADDSDYLAFDIPRVLSLRNLRGMRTTLIDREAKAKIFPGLLPEYWPLLATLSGNDYGRRVGFLDNFGPGDAAAPGDDYFARASGFILEHVQGKGIGPHDANAIANAIAAYARTLPRDFRRTAPQPAKLAERLRASLRQYSFDGIRDGVDTHLVPAALRAPGVWERVVAMHTEGVLDYECLSVLAKRLVNFGVVVEQKPTAPGALPGTWELTKELFRRVYGVLLADPGAEDKPKVHPAAATPPTPHSLPDILPTAKPSFSPIPPLSGVVPSSAANPSPPSSPAPPPGLSPRFPPSPPRSSPSPFPNPAPWLGDPAVVAAVPSKPSTASAFGSGAWAPAQPADAFPAPPEDDEVDENGFRDSVARIAGLIGEDEDSGEPAVAAEEPDADLEEVEDDLEEEARKLLAESGDEEGDDDDLSTIADAEELLEQGKVAEWVMSVGKHFTEPEKASATLEINGQSLPSLVSLLTAQQHQRLRAFYLCAGAPSDFHLNYGTPPVLTAVCLALRHLVSNPNFAARVKPLEAQALLAQAVNQAMRSPSYRGRPAAAANPWDVPLSPRTVHLGNLFLRTMLALSMLNDACCRPLGDSVSRAWKYFDGVMWQRRLNQARQAADAGGSGTDSLLDRQPEMVVFRMCWQQVVRGTVWQGLVAPEQRGQPYGQRPRQSAGQAPRPVFQGQGQQQFGGQVTILGNPSRQQGAMTGRAASSVDRPPVASFIPTSAMLAQVVKQNPAVQLPPAPERSTPAPARPPAAAPATLVISKVFASGATKTEEIPIQAQAGDAPAAAVASASSLVPDNSSPPSGSEGKSGRRDRQRQPAQSAKQSQQATALLQSTLDNIKATIEQQKTTAAAAAKKPANQGGKEQAGGGGGRQRQRGGRQAAQAAPQPEQSQQPGVCPHYAAGACAAGFECPMPHVAGVQKPVRRPVS